MSLLIGQKVVGGKSLVTIAGGIDLDSGMQLSKLSSTIAGEVTIDLSGVRKINSEGVASWLQFLRSAKTKSKLSYALCSPAFQVHLLMVPAFVEGVDVLSLSCDAICENCDRGVRIQVDRQYFVERKLEVCPACKGAMVLEIDEELPKDLGWR